MRYRGVNGRTFKIPDDFCGILNYKKLVIAVNRNSRFTAIGVQAD
jgi:hypothetical protein